MALNLKQAAAKLARLYKNMDRNLAALDKLIAAMEDGAAGVAPAPKAAKATRAAKPARATKATTAKATAKAGKVADTKAAKSKRLEVGAKVKAKAKPVVEEDDSDDDEVVVKTAKVKPGLKPVRRMKPALM